MMFSPRQIRAARALINWSQSDLAEHSGLARPTIANLEAGNQEPGWPTLQKIETAFDLAGVEFTANEGVRKKSNETLIFRGTDEFKKFFDFVYEYAKEYGGPIYLNNVQNHVFEQWYPGFFESDYVINMTAIKDQIDFRMMTREGNTRFPLKDKYATYRWLPEKKFTGLPFEVFGDYLAVFFLTEEPVVFVFKNKETADMYRAIFLHQWDKAIVPPIYEEGA